MSLGLQRKFVECDDFVLLSLFEKCLHLERKSIEGDLILLCLTEISLDLDKKFVECETNFAS